MAIVKLSADLRQLLALGLIARLDADSGPAKIEFYAGTILADTDTAITSQTLLGTVTCSDPSSTSTAGVITFDTITQDSAADASGTMSFALLKDNSGDPVMLFDVTATGGGGALTANTLTIVAGGPIACGGLTLTMPGA